MEHRSGSRKPLNFSVELLHCDRSYGFFKSENIGHGGLFVNAGERFKTGDYITAKVLADESGSDSFHQINAIVVHSSENGMGLMWVDYNIPFFNTLDYILSSAA